MSLTVQDLKISEIIAICGHVPGLTLGNVKALEKGGAKELDQWPLDKALLFSVGIRWVGERRARPSFTFDEAMALMDADVEAAEPDPPTPAPKKRTSST